MAARIFVSVAEQSADEHAAELIRAFRERHPGAVFSGLAGPAMQAAGCECIHDMTTRSAMALAAIARVPEALRLMNRLKKHLAEQSYDAAVVVDSPALNLSVAKLCRRRGIPVLYYIAPQTWAWGWRRWRNARLRNRVNRVACIWPFEEPHFRRDGIEAIYVGHPSFDRLLKIEPEESRVAALKAGASPVITILPGSREHVIHEVLPGQLEIAAALALRHRRSRFLVVAASDRAAGQIQALSAAQGQRVNFEMLRGDAERAAAIRAADLVLVASGTITLEVAYRAAPMIVMYNTARWGYLLVGQWLLTTPCLSIPNILAGREIVPEFMPYYKSTDPIIARAVEWLANPAKLERVRQDLADTIRPLIRGGAAENVARELESLITPKSAGSGAAPKNQAVD